MFVWKNIRIHRYNWTALLQELIVLNEDITDRVM